MNIKVLTIFLDARPQLQICSVMNVANNALRLQGKRAN